MYCYYIPHDSGLDFDESMIAKFKKIIALSILNGKGAGDGSDVILKVLFKFVKSRLITK